MTSAGAEQVRVWDLPVRIVHWGLVVGVATAWFTGHGPPWLHDGTGYAVLALVSLRFIRGVFGPRADRFTRFVPGAGETLAYARKVRRGQEPRFLGHNPLGGWMIVALLMAAFGAGVSGWLYTTDRFWGVEWVEDLHESLANLLVILIVIHVAGVVFTSLRQGENLVAAMVHGRKPRTTSVHPEEPIDH